MIVTFISQCQKKAHNRTRRILDAFANRIGNNAWQTPITGEGLDAIKKLLRQTASKNTAVSCHQLKSRIRTELLWIIGNRDKFNSEGIVPVNYTEQDKFIGEINMSEIYANTKKQPLDQHLFAVGVVAKEIIKTFTMDEQLQEAGLLAGYWHDIGKLEVHFQSWLNDELKKKNPNLELPENGVHIEKGNFSWEKYPTHNEVSTLIYELLADDSNFGKGEKTAIKHAIYWHHAKPIRKNELKSLTQVVDFLKDNDLHTLINQSKAIFKNVNDLSENYFDESFIKTKEAIDYHDEINGVSLPKYKTYESSENLTTYQTQIKKNAKENLIRTAVISADRLVSSLNSEALLSHIDNKTLEDFAKTQFITERGLKQYIQQCLEGFNHRENAEKDRNIRQKQAAIDLADEEINIGVLNGPAGCGKTKIALEWALNVSAKQIFWICPRVAICQSLYKDLTSNDYLPNATIEVHTGEFKYNNKNSKLEDDDYFTGDIILTTIDQIINSITTHKNIATLTKFMNATVVFDEFHEYIPMAGFNILFAELIECKKLQQNDETLPNTLLVSATPNYYFIKQFLNLKEDEIVGINSFNNKAYKIEFIDYDESLEDETNPLYQKQTPNTFVISNTAITAQKSFIDNQAKENSLLTHSKFTPKDRAEIFKKVIDNFEKDGLHEIDILRSGPVIQASLNISCENIISEMTTAENILQRLGRLNRFAKYDTATLKIALTESIKTGKQTGKVAKFLARNFQWQSTKVWIEFLKDQLEGKQGITINDLYQWYQKFYESGTCIQMVEQDFIKSLIDGIRVIDTAIFEPKRIKLSKTSTIKLKKHSLRGNSRFVQMAIYDVKNQTVLNKYLSDAITLSVNEIINYGDDDNALEFMSKKHHNIVENIEDYGVKAKTKFKSKVYLEKSRDPETPIFVSYTQQDLDKKVKESVKRDYAIYYVQGVKQPIGIMALSKLNNE